MHHLSKQGWKIIYLTRRNLLRQAFSELIKRHQKEVGKPFQYKRDDGGFSLGKIDVDCVRLLEMIKEQEYISNQEKDVLKGLSHLEVVYEDDLLREEDHQRTLNRISDYLSIPQAPVKTDLVRMVGESLADYVQNYGQLIEAIGSTKYAKFLGDDR